jgi:hypothetical protein
LVVLILDGETILKFVLKRRGWYGVERIYMEE